MSNTATAAHDDHRPNVKLYMAVFGALLFFTCVTVVISKFHLPRPQAIALGLLVASIKAALVAAIFMHLWGESRLIHKFLLVAFACGAIMVIPMIDFVLIDPRTTSPIAVADQHPDEGAAAEPKTDAASAAAAPAAVPAPAAAPKRKGKKK
jgi:caa(3)-type oxidase subunit IV